MSKKQKTRVTDKSGEIDKQKRQRFENQISTFESDMDEVNKGDEDPLAVDDRMETALSNIDETITTLQTRKESVEGKLDDRKSEVGSSNLKEIKNQGLHDKQMYTYQEDLAELNAEIKDWRAYQIEIQDLSRQMLRMQLQKLQEDEVDVEAAKRYTEMVDDKIENIKDIIDSAMDERTNIVESRVDAKWGEKNARIESRVTALEKDVEYMQRNFADVLTAVTNSLEQVSENLERDAQLREQIQETQEKTKKMSNGVDMADRAESVSDKVPEPSEGTGQEEPEMEAEQVSTVSGSGESSLEGTSVGSPEDDSTDSTDSGAVTQPDSSSGSNDPKYKFKMRAYSEMKETFEQIDEEMDDEEITLRKIADRSDVSYTSIREKLQKVRDKHEDQEILPQIEIG